MTPYLDWLKQPFAEKQLRCFANVVANQLFSESTDDTIDQEQRFPQEKKQDYADAFFHFLCAAIGAYQINRFIKDDGRKEVVIEDINYRNRLLEQSERTAQSANPGSEEFVQIYFDLNPSRNYLEIPGIFIYAAQRAELIKNTERLTRAELHPFTALYHGELRLDNLGHVSVYGQEVQIDSDLSVDVLTAELEKKLARLQARKVQKISSSDIRL